MTPRFVTGARTPRAPTQARSIASRERLLDAAERLLGEYGYEETSVGEIVHEAHASVGVFYNRFVDKAEIFRAVQERLLERLLAMWTAVLDPVRWRDAGLAEIVTGIVADLASFLRANGLLLRAIGARNVADEHVGAISQSVSQLLVAPLSGMLLQRRSEISHSNPELAVDIGFRMVYATLRQAVLYGDVRPTGEAGSWALLTSELTRAYQAYLRDSG
jgi:AcrR family transcriptional regulator